jgi:hypothetical protein
LILNFIARSARSRTMKLTSAGIVLTKITSPRLQDQPPLVTASTQIGMSTAAPLIMSPATLRS